jgi:hypothetical protein
MSAKLAAHGVYLQDYIGKVKQLATTALTAELEDSKMRENKTTKPEAARELNRDMDNMINNIRKVDTLVPALDAFCGSLPLIVKEINIHEAEDPPLSFVLKNLVVAAVSSTVNLFDLYYRTHYRMANFEKNDSVRDRFFSFRVVDYVRLLQILSWFIPVCPVFPDIDRKMYTQIEPLFKAVESDQIYSVFESKTSKLANYWKSQAERDLMNQGREIHK